MDPLQYVLQRALDGDHQGLLMLLVAGAGLHRWWMSVKPDIMKASERVLVVLETFSTVGVKVSVKHEGLSGGTGGAPPLNCLFPAAMSLVNGTNAANDQAVH